MNPYEVLGVSPYASPEEVRAAYLRLVKKYHPDRYQDSCLKKQAEDKMKRINAAYDMITKKQEEDFRTKRDSAPKTGADENYGEYTHGFNEVRRMINEGDMLGAVSALSAIPVRNAEWHFLYGICCYRNAQYSRAYDYISRACKMDPENHEYATALNTMRGTTRTSGSSPDLSDAFRCCGLISSVACANILCRWFC